MTRIVRGACLLVLAGLAAGCQTPGADDAQDAGSDARDAAYDCAAAQYDRIFRTAGQDDRLYNVEDRSRITGMLRDSAAAGQGAGEDAERRIRNMLGDGYGRLFLDAFAACMRDDREEPLSFLLTSSGRGA